MKKKYRTPVHSTCLNHIGFEYAAFFAICLSAVVLCITGCEQTVDPVDTAGPDLNSSTFNSNTTDTDKPVTDKSVPKGGDTTTGGTPVTASNTAANGEATTANSGNGNTTGAEFNSVAALKTYLEGLPANTEDTPYKIKLSGIDLASTETKGNTLKTLYDALIHYVELDLSGCTGESISSITVTKSPNKANIVSLVLPETVTTIHYNAFADCSALVSIKMPKVTSIAYGAFKQCSKLRVVDVPELQTMIDKEKSGASDGIFYKCSALTTVSMPKVTRIGAYAFYECDSLRSLSLPETVSIGDYAFKNCDVLTSITLPEAVSIGNQSFQGCKSLAALSVPKAASIGTQAFYNCPNLSTITLGNTPPVLETNNIFTKYLVTIYVPAGAVAAYQNIETPSWTAELKEKIKALSL